MPPPKNALSGVFRPKALSHHCDQNDEKSAPRKISSLGCEGPRSCGPLGYFQSSWRLFMFHGLSVMVIGPRGGKERSICKTCPGWENGCSRKIRPECLGQPPRSARAERHWAAPLLGVR